MFRKVTVNVGVFDVPPHESSTVPIGLAIPGAREPDGIDLVLSSDGTHGDLYAAYLRHLTPEQRLAMPGEKKHHDAELGLGVFDENIDRLPSIIPFRQTTEKPWQLLNQHDDWRYAPCMLSCMSDMILARSETPWVPWSCLSAPSPERPKK